MPSLHLRRIATLVMLLASFGNAPNAGGSGRSTMPQLVALAASPNPFDGEWRVESVRQEGQCIERSSYIVSINDGVMTAKVTGRLGAYTYSGRVSEEGSFEARIQGKFDSVSVRGLLTGDNGDARWSSVSKCLGTMTLERVK